MGIPSEKLEITCQSCGAAMVIEPELRTARCPYCDSPSVVDRPETADRPDPAFVIGFAVDRNRATARMREFIARRKMAPFGLKDKTADRVYGVYLPNYIYSATAASRFSANIAEEYESVGVHSDSDGSVSVGKKRKTEYYGLQGVHTTSLGDIVVTASRGISNAEIEAIEPFEPEGLRRYSAAMISGWISEEPTLTREETLDLARAEARSKVTELLRRFMPGDGYSNLRQRTALHEESIDLTLLPVWVFAIRHSEQKPPIRVLVNGQTGAVGGTIPISWGKIAIIAAIVSGLLALPGLIGIVMELFR